MGGGSLAGIGGVSGSMSNTTTVHLPNDYVAGDVVRVNGESSVVTSATPEWFTAASTHANAALQQWREAQVQINATGQQNLQNWFGTSVALGAAQAQITDAETAMRQRLEDYQLWAQNAESEYRRVVRERDALRAITPQPPVGIAEAATRPSRKIRIVEE